MITLMTYTGIIILPLDHLPICYHQSQDPYCGDMVVQEYNINLLSTSKKQQRQQKNKFTIQNRGYMADNKTQHPFSMSKIEL